MRGLSRCAVVSSPALSVITQAQHKHAASRRLRQHIAGLHGKNCAEPVHTRHAGACSHAISHLRRRGDYAPAGHTAPRAAWRTCAAALLIGAASRCGRTLMLGGCLGAPSPATTVHSSTRPCSHQVNTRTRTAGLLDAAAHSVYSSSDTSKRVPSDARAVEWLAGGRRPAGAHAPRTADNRRASARAARGGRSEGHLGKQGPLHPVRNRVPAGCGASCQVCVHTAQCPTKLYQDGPLTWHQTQL